MEVSNSRFDTYALTNSNSGACYSYANSYSYGNGYKNTDSNGDAKPYSN
ncbi:MAG: hypothetical protein ACEQSB_07310 [Undibacterium sp.]